MTKQQLVLRELFYFFTALIGACLLLEIIWPNLILAYFNVDYLLVLWLAVGLAGLVKK